MDRGCSLGSNAQVLKGHSDGVIAVVFSPDGKQLASGSFDETIRIWDIASGATLQVLKGHSSSIDAVAFSPDSNLLASGSYKSVRVWNTATGATMQVLEGHSDEVSAVAFSSDGKQLASSSEDKTLRIWDAASGAALQTYTFYTRISMLSFSGDGSFLFTSCGQLDLTSLYSPLRHPLRCPKIFLEDEWIALGPDRMLWLPPNYRPSCSAVYENVVCLGNESGRILIFEFS